jgi:hypothetical protein
MYTLLNGILNDLSYSLTERLDAAAEIFLRGCQPPRSPGQGAKAAGRRTD